MEGDGERRGRGKSGGGSSGEKGKLNHGCLGPWGELSVTPVLILVIKTFREVKGSSSTPLRLPLQAHLSTDV